MTALTVTDLIEKTKKYLTDLESGATFDVMSQYYAEDCVQEEFPNRLVTAGAKRTLADLKAASERGFKAVENQRYEILNIFGQDNQVVCEVQWSANVLMTFGSLKPGDPMRARFAVFIVYNDEGRIKTQHNYDCFEAF